MTADDREQPGAVGRLRAVDLTDETPASPDHTALDHNPPDSSAPADPPLDLARIERDLSGVEEALRRLDDGTYWTDEVTGAPIPDADLAADPVLRRVAPDA